MTLARLLEPGGLRTLLAERTALQSLRGEAGGVATVATVAVATNEMALADACRMVGLDPASMPEVLRADLLKTGGCDLPYLAAVIKEDSEWYGWAGVTRLADYAPGGRYYRETSP